MGAPRGLREHLSALLSLGQLRWVITHCNRSPSLKTGHNWGYFASFWPTLRRKVPKGIHRGRVGPRSRMEPGWYGTQKLTDGTLWGTRGVHVGPLAPEAQTHPRPSRAAALGFTRKTQVGRRVCRRIWDPLERGPVRARSSPCPHVRPGRTRVTHWYTWGVNGLHIRCTCDQGAGAAPRDTPGALVGRVCHGRYM